MFSADWLSSDQPPDRVPVSEWCCSDLGSGDGPVHAESAAGNKGGYDTGGAEPGRRPLLPLPLQDGEWRASNPTSGGFAPVIISMLLYADSLISLAVCVGISCRCSNMAVMPPKPPWLQRIHYGLLANMEARGPLGAPYHHWPERSSGREETWHASKQLILLCFLRYRSDVQLYSQSSSAQLGFQSEVIPLSLSCFFLPVSLSSFTVLI